MVENKLIKSRDIPIGSYYTNLQLEYIGYRLRQKLYKRPNDKQKFCDICKGKKEVIQDLALKNMLPSIFNSEDSRKKYMDKFFNEWGLPNFRYRDDHQKRVKGRWDARYYFNKGVDVKVRIDGEIKLGTIVGSNIDAEVSKETNEVYYPLDIVYIDCEGETLDMHMCDVGRIISTDFFEKI